MQQLTTSYNWRIVSQMPAQTLELFQRTDEEAARQQLQDTGHAGFANLYDPELAKQAAKEALALCRGRKPYERTLGEQTSRLKASPDEAMQRALYEVIQGLREGAALLGLDLTPATGEKPFMLHIDMARSTKGKLHRDRGLIHAVGVTTLKDVSTLWYESPSNKDGVMYELAPGGGAFHDLDRDLLHQGSASPEAARIGLVLSREAA